jgi:hypothetical protein
MLFHFLINTAFGAQLVQLVQLVIVPRLVNHKICPTCQKSDITGWLRYFRAFLACKSLCKCGKEFCRNTDGLGAAREDFNIIVS